MKSKEVHELSDNELDEQLVKAKEELFNLRFQLATGQLENYHRLKLVRKDIARIKTVKKERELKSNGDDEAKAEAKDETKEKKKLKTKKEKVKK